MKKILVRELFWFVISLLISLIGSFIFLEILAISSTEPELNSLEKLFTIQLYIIGCMVTFISVYIVRIVVSFVQKRV
jgi:hypothetical protein